MKSLNDYFDNIYVLNLNHRVSRFKEIKNRLDRFNIKFERYNATDGAVIKKIWQSFNNNNFSTPNYLACAISHLSIYNDAQVKGYDKILILEDDVVINKNINKLLQEGMPEWQDILYLGWIPLSDDLTMWTYEMAQHFMSNRVLFAHNFWGMFAYGITKSFRQEILDTYDKEFPMELDRYLVSNFQHNNRCLALTPQLFACQDIWSDNMNNQQIGMLDRSVDRRFAKSEDYI